MELVTTPSHTRSRDLKPVSLTHTPHPSLAAVQGSDASTVQAGYIAFFIAPLGACAMVVCGLTASAYKPQLLFMVRHPSNQSDVLEKRRGVGDGGAWLGW